MTNKLFKQETEKYIKFLRDNGVDSFSINALFVDDTYPDGQGFHPMWGSNDRILMILEKAIANLSITQGIPVQKIIENVTRGIKIQIECGIKHIQDQPCTK